MNTIEIVSWNPGTLAVTGVLPDPHKLLDCIREVVTLKMEFFSGQRFTFSFPERHRRQVVRIVERQRS